MLDASQSVDTSGNSTALPAFQTATPIPVPTTPVTINSSNIQPQSPINYTTPTSVPVYPTSTLAPVQPASLTPTEGGAENLTTKLQSLNELLIGKSADQTAAESAAGIPTLEATQNDLTAKLTALTNEASAIPLQLQTDASGRGITTDGLAPIQTAALRNNAIEALNVSTLLAATKGNLTTAQAFADKAISQKYDPITEQITAATANLNLILNSPEYSNEEKAQAQTQLNIQNQKQDAIDQAKSDATAISQIAIKAAANGADATTLANIQKAKSPADAATAAGTFGADLTTQTAVVNGRNVLINSKTGAVIKDLGAAKATGTQSEQFTAALAGIQSALQKNTPLANGHLPVDANGYITPEALSALMSAAPSEGGTAEDVISALANKIFAPEGVVSPKYGLTPKQQKLITG